MSILGIQLVKNVFVLLLVSKKEILYKEKNSIGIFVIGTYYRGADGVIIVYDVCRNSIYLFFFYL
jgi:hypothetical protein